MILQKALKEKNRLVQKISKTKGLIQSKNSYREGKNTAQDFNVDKLMEELIGYLEQLTTLKLIINEANREIQAYIYQIAEYKSFVSFLQGIDTSQGENESYAGIVTTRIAQLSEIEINKMIEEYENKIDILQEEIDRYNYTTDIPWDKKQKNI